MDLSAPPPSHPFLPLPNILPLRPLPLVPDPLLEPLWRLEIHRPNLPPSRAMPDLASGGFPGRKRGSLVPPWDMRDGPLPVPRLSRL